MPNKTEEILNDRCDDGNQDPWKNRTQGMRCQSCMWFVVKEQIKVEGDPLIVPIKGRCRRHAPTMNGYPVVFPADWCGDHKLV